LTVLSYDPLAKFSAKTIRIGIDVNLQTDFIMYVSLPAIKETPRVSLSRYYQFCFRQYNPIRITSDINRWRHVLIYHVWNINQWEKIWRVFPCVIYVRNLNLDVFQFLVQILLFKIFDVWINLETFAFCLLDILNDVKCLF
jgi:hypothetical protein